MTTSAVVQQEPFFYSVTAHQPTAVSHAVVGNFTRVDETNLLISRGTRLEIFTLTESGLVGITSIPIYGRISVLFLFRPSGEKQDLAFLCTERYNCCVLGWDSDRSEVVSRALGDVRDRVGRSVESGQIGVVDPESRAIALHLYDGFLKIVPVGPRGELREAFSIRIEELRVVDVQFLEGCERPTLAVLHSDSRDCRHVKTYEVFLEERELKKGPWSMANVEAGSNLIVPVSSTGSGGAVIIGEQTLAYHGPTEASRTVSIAVRPTVARAWGKVDQSRFLVGDHAGRLHMLSLIRNTAGHVSDMRLDLLGETSIASAISYLDSGCVFIGSTLGDSQVVRLGGGAGTLSVLDVFTNLGPISDLAVVDTDRRGQGQVVACSGGFKDGALHVIRNGVGVNEESSLDMPGIQGLWSLRAPDAGESPPDRYLVLSFAAGTQLLELRESTLAASSIPGFALAEQTLCCGSSAKHAHVVQVTPTAVRVVDASQRRAGVLSSWSPPGSATVKVASLDEGCSRLLLSHGGGSLALLEFGAGDGKIVAKSVVVADIGSEVACVSAGGAGKFCAAATWDCRALVLALPDLRVVHSEKLEGDAVPRSVLVADLGGRKPSAPFLLCGMGDGHLISFCIDAEAGVARDRKKVSLGTKPVGLRQVRAHVFAACNRPTVIYTRQSPTPGGAPSPSASAAAAAGQKLLFSNVNLREVSHVCSFNKPPGAGREEEEETMETEDGRAGAAAVGESLALVTEDRLVIGTIDEIQKLHIRKMAQNEMPRRIAYQEATRQYAVLTVRTAVDASSGEETETCFVRLFDEQLIEARDTYQLEKGEIGCSVAAVQLPEGGAEGPQPYFVVGTARIVAMEPEPSAGRLLVFKAAAGEGKLGLVAEKDVRGAVYSIDQASGKVVAAINSRVHMFSWSETPQPSESKYARSLISHCEHQGHILALRVATVGELIAVGDLMKSVTLLSYRPGEQRIEEVARDFQPGWVASLCPVSEDALLVAENSYNLFCLTRNAEAETDEDRARLVVSAEFHLGEFVNALRPGSLVVRDPAAAEEDILSSSFIWGSASGAIGVIARISAEQFQFFSKVQENIAKIIQGVGGLSHSFWRSFSNERRTAPARNFLDGDLIESFLDLRHDKMALVVSGLGVSVDELCKRIEALQRATH